MKMQKITIKKWSIQLSLKAGVERYRGQNHGRCITHLIRLDLIKCNSIVIAVQAFAEQKAVKYRLIYRCIVLLCIKYND